MEKLHQGTINFYDISLLGILGCNLQLTLTKFHLLSILSNVHLRHIHLEAFGKCICLSRLTNFLIRRNYSTLIVILYFVFIQRKTWKNIKMALNINRIHFILSLQNKWKYIITFRPVQYSIYICSAIYIFFKILAQKSAVLFLCDWSIKYLN